MKLFTKVTTLLMVLLLTGGMAWAATYEDHVYVAPNGQGEVLIFPVYMAFDGFQTKLQVINTSLEMSAVAKVVIRSPLYSSETRDFLIFLSPTDVWEGWLKWDGSQVIIYSEDDSMLAAVELVDGALEPVFASPADPFSIHLEDPDCGDFNLWGYAEVFLARVFPELEPARIPKEDIFKAYIGTGTVTIPSPSADSYTPASAKALGYNPNILAGNQQIQSPILGWSSALNAVTLANYGNRHNLNPGEDTRFGDRANNSIEEVEAELSKNFVGMPYINDDEGNTLHFFTFPTKLTDLDADCDFVDDDYAGFGRFVGFELDADGDDPGVRFLANQYDMTERTPVGDQPIFSPQPKTPDAYLMELDFVMPQAFSKGWYRYGFELDRDRNSPWTGGLTQALQPIVYSGAPVIPVVMNFGSAGFSTMYGNWSEGDVCGFDDEFVCFDGYQSVYSWAHTSPGVQ